MSAYHLIGPLKEYLPSRTNSTTMSTNQLLRSKSCPTDAPCQFSSLAKFF